VLEPIDVGLPVAEVISQMYERADGSGYPFGKKNDGIHPLARLLAVCDVFCALISPRAYRDAKSFEDALALLRKDSTKFDPKVISALDEVLAPEHSSRLRADLTATPAA
jgi:HD-GYP domain-containing protein (c-di-GMP phosphodiesterase class II)